VAEAHPQATARLSPEITPSFSRAPAAWLATGCDWPDSGLLATARSTVGKHEATLLVANGLGNAAIAGR
jgi:hypothetical protein